MGDFMLLCFIRVIVWILLMGFIVGGQGLTTSYVFADQDADTIIQRVEENLNGDSMVMDLTMVVATQRFQRTMMMRSYAVGTNKSFIQILYPGKDRGITFLKIDNAMWQYVPRIEKIIKIPASMMLQSWMGSDFTNDDLVRESSISEDYHKKIQHEDGQIFIVELIPKEDAAVVWGKVIMAVDKGNYLPTKVSYFDEDGMLIRELIYTDVQLFGTQHYPTRWIMLPKETDKVGHQTTVQISNLIVDSDIDPAYFTKRALKQFSQ